MPFTCVVDRPDLQSILLSRTQPHVRNAASVDSYIHEGNGLIVTLEDGQKVHGDVLVGADGIWSSVRAAMRGEPARGDGSGVSYSGYTVFAGELEYGGQDPTSGYTVYIGPQQYFVITDIGKGRYQW
jgi:zeaxanthin epoxidase